MRIGLRVEACLDGRGEKKNKMKRGVHTTDEMATMQKTEKMRFEDHLEDKTDVPHAKSEREETFALSGTSATTSGCRWS